MEKLGLVGGISWVSTMEYYRLINQGINEKLGGLNFSECIIYSFNYADIKKNNDNNDWESTFNLVVTACHKLKSSGAKGIVLCANTMHFIADKVEKEIGIPVIHIATATANEIEKAELKKIGLLGTKFTMELDFFKSKLHAKGIEVIIPDEAERSFVQETIYEELGKGIINPSTKQRYLTIIEDLINSGAEGIILGCTEIPMLIQQADVSVPIFDTLLIHAKEAVSFSLTETNTNEIAL